MSIGTRIRKWLQAPYQSTLREELDVAAKADREAEKRLFPNVDPNHCKPTSEWTDEDFAYVMNWDLRHANTLAVAKRRKL